MNKDLKAVVIMAVAMWSIPTVAAAAKAPDMIGELFDLEDELVVDSNLTLYRDERERFEGAPVSAFSIALAEPDNESELNEFVARYEDAIRDNLAPAVEDFRRKHSFTD